MSENIIPDFTPGAAINIAYQSVTTTTGSGEPVEPLASLAKYNAKGADIPAIRDKVMNNTDFGLPLYHKTMDPNALKDMSPAWTLQKLADVIFNEAG